MAIGGKQGNIVTPVEIHAPGETVAKVNDFVTIESGEGIPAAAIWWNKGPRGVIAQIPQEDSTVTASTRRARFAIIEVMCGRDIQAAQMLEFELTIKELQCWVSMVGFQEKGFACAITLVLQSEIEVIITTVPVVDRPDPAGIICEIHLPERVGQCVGAEKSVGHPPDDIEQNEVVGRVSNQDMVVVPPSLQIALDFYLLEDASFQVAQEKSRPFLGVARNVAALTESR